MIGQFFGKWKVVDEATHKYATKSVGYLCICTNCNKTTKVVQRQLLLNGRSKQCSECPRTDYKRRGDPTHNTWRAMRQRCNNPTNNRYSRYGGRGITVCERWDDFKNFLKDMGQKPKGKQLDRIDTNGNYCRENCRWVSPKENCITRSKRPCNLPRRPSVEKRMKKRLLWEKKWIKEHNKPH